MQVKEYMYINLFLDFIKVLNKAYNKTTDNIELNILTIIQIAPPKTRAIEDIININTFIIDTTNIMFTSESLFISSLTKNLNII